MIMKLQSGRNHSPEGWKPCKSEWMYIESPSKCVFSAVLSVYGFRLRPNCLSKSVVGMMIDAIYAAFQRINMKAFSISCLSFHTASLRLTVPAFAHCHIPTSVHMPHVGVGGPSISDAAVHCWLFKILNKDVDRQDHLSIVPILQNSLFIGFVLQHIWAKRSVYTLQYSVY